MGGRNARLSDALGTATEQRAMRNYAGHRLAPWLAHVMVSRQETARPLLTPGEVMQLPNDDEVVMVSGLAPIRAKKLRYYVDANFAGRVLPAPVLNSSKYADCPTPRSNDWGRFARKPDVRLGEWGDANAEGEDGGLQQERHPSIEEDAPKPIEPVQGDLLGFDDDSDAVSDKRAMDQARATNAPLIAAHAANEGKGHDDLVPSF